MNKISLTRGAWLGGAACALLTVAASAIPAEAQNYPPGTNCQSLLPGLRANCIDQARQMNSGTNTIPNSGGANTVSPPGSVNSGTNVTPNGTMSPNAVTPNGTVSPNAVTPNGTVSPNAVQTPNSAPNSNQVIIPPAGAGAGTMSPNTGGMGTGTGGGTGTGAGGAAGGASGN